MDSSSTHNFKKPLKQPMLVIGGLAGGIIAGLVLSLAMAPANSTPKKHALPADFNIAQNTNQSGTANSTLTAASNAIANPNATDTHEGEHSIDHPTYASKHNWKYKKAFTTLPDAIILDPAAAYLTASKSLTHESKTLLPSINNTRFDRPAWSWSKENLSVTRAIALNVSHKAALATNDGLFITPDNSTELNDPATALTTAEQHLAEVPEVEAVVVPDILAKDRLVVVLDPGHGGTDPGSEAHNGLIEKELTLDMARRVELFLSEVENVDVVMTRNKDVGMSRQNRVNKIKQVGADVVVSLHFNHLPQTDLNLVETFYADRHNVVESLTKQKKSLSSVNLDHTSASRTLAHIMHKKVFNEVANANAQSMAPGTVIDAGVKQDTLFVLTRSFTPGVLLELTCISNPQEAERLITPEYRNQLAASIADGLRDYLSELHGEKYDELLVKLDL